MALGEQRRFPGGKPARVYALPPPGHTTCPTRLQTRHDLARRTASNDARISHDPPSQRTPRDQDFPSSQQPTDRSLRHLELPALGARLRTPPPAAHEPHNHPRWAGGRAVLPSDRHAPTTNVRCTDRSASKDPRFAPRAASRAGSSGPKCRPYLVKAGCFPSRDRTKVRSRQPSPRVQGRRLRRCMHRVGRRPCRPHRHRVQTGNYRYPCITVHRPAVLLSVGS